MPKTKTIQVTLYRFEELDKEAQERAFEDNRWINLSLGLWANKTLKNDKAKRDVYKALTSWESVSKRLREGAFEFTSTGELFTDC